ncbi:MAG: MFS transporter [Chloroflexi bacterium HGW-Chloroflexi-5]|jgi:DHA3 family macrolide efflux protein-like MFS transporter|nr:MAG: MFS transporter [Chloroflexi bacterium HGW-Chloroflexi-5]
MENTTFEIGKNWMKKFVPIWSAQLFSLLGSSLVQFALIWWITQQTGSATYLAMATLVAVLPEVLLSPFAGALVDRLNRRYVMIAADVAIALLTLSLAILFAFDMVQIWHVFVVMFLRSIGSVFHWPAMQASTSLMVPEKHLARVAGINQALRGSLSIIAPPLGALLMSVLKFYQVIAVDVITAIIAITPLLFIRIPQPVRADAGKVLTPRVLLKDVAEGFNYIKNWKGLLYLTLLAAMLNFLLAPTFTLLPLMITQHFKAGVWELSAIESSIGIGIVIGGLVLGVWGGFKNKMLTTLVGILGLGIGVLLFGLTPANAFWMGLASMVLLGFMNPIANGPIQAIVQSKVAPEMQGRVMGTTSAICTAMMPLSMVVVAPVAELLGLRVWYWAGGTLTILIALAAFFIPSIMSLGSSQKDISTAQIAAD